MFRSRFFWQLFGGYVVVVAVTALALWAALSRWVSEDSITSIRSELTADTALVEPVARELLRSENPVATRALVDRLGEETRTRITVIASDGTVLADSEWNPLDMDDHGSRPEVVAARETGLGSSERFSDTVRREMIYVARAIREDGALLGFARVAVPRSEVDTRLGELTRLITLGALAASLAALVIGFLAVRWVRAPISSMTSLAESMSSGEYARRVPVESADELGQLATAFNRMAEHVESRMDTITKDRNLLQAIFTSMVEGVVAVDRDERIVHINAVAGRILGVRPSEALGQRFWETARVEEVASALATSLEGKPTTPSQCSIAREGGEHLVEVNASPLRDSASDLVGAVVVLHDVTSMRRLEQVRSEFVVNASHELKTPIAAIHGILETVASEPEMPTDTRQNFLRRAATQGARLSSLVTDLIQLSRLEADPGAEELSPIDIHDVVVQSITGRQGLANDKDVALQAERNGTPVRVLGDRATLGLIVDNLVDNAVKYTPSGGNVVVRVLDRDGLAVIEVEDDGVGIEPKHQDRIFERFYRVDKARSRELGGTGLGLAIVKHAVGVLGGELTVESEPGRGSTFRVRLPRVD